MNPYGVVGHHYDTTAIAAWNRDIQRSMDDYHIHPFTYCTHNGACDLRWRRWGVR